LTWGREKYYEAKTSLQREREGAQTKEKEEGAKSMQKNNTSQVGEEGRESKVGGGGGLLSSEGSERAFFSVEVACGDLHPWVRATLPPLPPLCTT